ncbi:GumC family protein [Mastigocladopsis repens]|uniref:GumC family protein n=1 Tax=Mastigocladopsis repens TaxID=221287 RepID=UPI000304D47E|nr:polysaccharide biosynthesis tyrosine autokinase [Mastigocladopsis repens]
MEISFLKTSSLNGNNGNRSYVPQLLPTQPLPLLEGQEDDWDLFQILGIIKRRALVIAVVITAVMACVVGVTLKQKPEYQAKFRILAEPVNSDDNTLPKIASDFERKLDKSSLDYETQIQVLKSPELMTSIVKQLQVSYPDINYDSLVNSLIIARLGETKIIEVRYQSHDPAKIKVVLDTLAQAYLKYSLENRQTNLRQGIQFVDKQLPSIQSRVDQFQQQLQKFRQDYDFIDPETQSQQIAQLAQLLSEQRLAINQQLTKARAYFTSLQGPEGAKAALSDAPVYQQLVIQIRQLEAQTASDLTRFQKDSLPIEILREKRQRLLPLLRQEAQRVWSIKVAEVANEIQNLESQSQTLVLAEKKLHQKAEQLPVLARQYTELQRNLQVATESLNRFLTTRENLQIEAAQTQIPWQLVQAPVQPQVPVSPNTQRNLILGFVASTLFGIGGALLTEKLDNTYHTVDALKDKLKLPLLATIPFEKQLSRTQDRTVADKTHTQLTNLPSQDSSKSDEIVKHLDAFVEDYNQYESLKFLEALRVLHTNIQLLSSDQRIRSIVISSAMAGDGKSTVAFHLAQIASAMGQRVLLVDADLRRPRIHALSNINNLWGLSSVISGSMPVETVIRQAPSMRELSIITAGPIPPDPTKLLSSQKMKQLMADFHQAFDLVIYDAPPLLGLADASLLAPCSDGIMLVARMHKTDRSALKEAIDSLKIGRSNILGLVVNGYKNVSHYNYYK